MLKKQSPNLRLIASYADPKEGHIGTIYQAMNWVYVGISKPQPAARINGKIIHKRTIHSQFGTLKGQELTKLLWKHKYLYPLDRAMRRQIAPLAQPYPKRDDAGEVSTVTRRATSLEGQVQALPSAP